LRAAICVSPPVQAVCGDLTRQLLNVAVGGARDYVHNLPESFVRSKFSLRHA